MSTAKSNLTGERQRQICRPFVGTRCVQGGCLGNATVCDNQTGTGCIPREPLWRRHTGGLLWSSYIHVALFLSLSLSMFIYIYTHIDRYMILYILYVYIYIYMYMYTHTCVTYTCGRAQRRDVRPRSARGSPRAGCKANDNSANNIIT